MDIDAIENIKYLIKFIDTREKFLEIIDKYEYIYLIYVLSKYKMLDDYADRLIQEESKKGIEFITSLKV